MMKKLLSLILALTLCAGLCLPALADEPAPGGFNPTLDIQKSSSQITVTMNDTNGKRAVLTIDCGSWRGAEVYEVDAEGQETKLEEGVSFQSGKVSFPTTGGAYVIKKVNVPASSGAAVSASTGSSLPTVPQVTEAEKAEIVETLTDVRAEDWYADDVAWAVGAGLMAGYGEDVFAPADELSRGMLVQVLNNLEQKPDTDGDSFSDVDEDDWCADAVAWAKDAGVTKGEGDGTFAAETPISRQELVVMLYRYAQKLGMDVSAGGDADILSYADAPDLAEWAYPAMQWACGAGLIRGRTDGTLDPWGTATRAEVAAVFQRLVKLMHQ